MQSSPGTVFVDTSAWKAFYDENDDWHKEARGFMNSVGTKQPPIRQFVTLRLRHGPLSVGDPCWLSSTDHKDEGLHPPLQSFYSLTRSCCWRSQSMPFRVGQQ